MAIEHDYFGLIDDDGNGGLYWSDMIELGDQAVSVDLSAAQESLVNDGALDSAAAILHSIDSFDDRARDALVAELSERESATVSYVDQQVDELGESLLDLLVHNSGDVQVDVLRSLQLIRVALHPENFIGEGEFAVFDYSIAPDDTDDLLVVTFAGSGDVVAVDTDS